MGNRDTKYIDKNGIERYKSNGCSVMKLRDYYLQHREYVNLNRQKFPVACRARADARLRTLRDGESAPPQGVQVFKYCPQCKEIKGWTGFHRSREASRGGLQARCASCVSGNNAKPGSMERRRVYDILRKSKQESRDRDKATDRKYKYGITEEEYIALHVRQGGRCANSGCRYQIERNSRECHTDHSHTTGQVRGLLCGECNRLLGKMEKFPDRFSGLNVYLLTSTHGGT